MFGYGVWEGWAVWMYKLGYKTTRLQLEYFLFDCNMPNINLPQNRFHSVRVTALEMTNALQPTIPLPSLLLQPSSVYLIGRGLGIQAQSQFAEREETKTNYVVLTGIKRKIGCVCMFVWCSSVRVCSTIMRITEVKAQQRWSKCFIYGSLYLLDRPCFLSRREKEKEQPIFKQKKNDQSTTTNTLLLQKLDVFYQSRPMLPVLVSLSHRESGSRKKKK